MFPRAFFAFAALAVAEAAAAGTLVTDITSSHANVTRYFDYFLPDDLPAAPVPLLFLLHGGTGDNDLLSTGASGRFLSLAEEHKFIVVMPNGIDSTTGLSGPSGDFNWNDCRLDAGPAETGADDVGFLAAVLDWAEANFAIDSDRVYATGSSNGGLMSFRLAFELSDRVAAIATNIANLPDATDCPAMPANPVGVFMTMGLADAIMPFAGGSVAGGRGSILSAAATRDFWTAFLGTAPVPNSIAVPDINASDDSSVAVDAFCGGAQASAAVYGLVSGGGHTLPSIAHPISAGLEALLGKQNRDLESADAAWAFLRHQHLSGADASCGNWCLDAGEVCDDGNQQAGDGCPATCGVVGQAVPALPPATPLALGFGIAAAAASRLRRSVERGRAESAESGAAESGAGRAGPGERGRVEELK